MPERDKSALIVPVPEAEPLVGGFRRHFDISAISGLEAHVTILSPFAPPDQLSAGILADARALFETTPRFAFSLAGVCGFRTVVYLVPEPLSRFLSLMQATAARFPEYPPYDGAFAEPVPHLTVAQSPPAEDLAGLSDRIVSQTCGRLPLPCSVHEVCLVVKQAGRWYTEERFPLA